MRGKQKMTGKKRKKISGCRAEERRNRNKSTRKLVEKTYKFKLPREMIKAKDGFKKKKTRKKRNKTSQNVLESDK